MAVSVLLGNIFDGGVDLTVLPCSSKPSISKFVRNWIELFRLANPEKFRYPLEHGGISKIYAFRHHSHKTKFYVYGASVLNDHSTPDHVFKIAKLIGQATQDREDIRNIECPLLGPGAGPLTNIESVTALSSGFSESAHADARLIIYTPNSNTHDEIKKALNTSKIEAIAERVKLTPSLFGVGIDLNKEKMRIAKALSKITFSTKPKSSGD